MNMNMNLNMNMNMNEINNSNLFYFYFNKIKETVNLKNYDLNFFNHLINSISIEYDKLFIFSKNIYNENLSFQAKINSLNEQIKILEYKLSQFNNIKNSPPGLYNTDSNKSIFDSYYLFNNNFTPIDIKQIINKSSIEDKSSINDNSSINDKSSIEDKSLVDNKSSIEDKSSIDNKSSIEDKSSIDNKSSIEDKSLVDNKSSIEDKSSIDNNYEEKTQILEWRSKNLTNHIKKKFLSKTEKMILNVNITDFHRILKSVMYKFQKKHLKIKQLCSIFYNKTHYGPLYFDILMTTFKSSSIFVKLQNDDQYIRKFYVSHKGNNFYFFDEKND